MTNISVNDVQVARTLRASEHAIDDALIQGSDYLRRLIEGRRQHNLPAEVGHDAISASVQTLTHLVSAREAQTRSHSAVQDVAETQGIPWRLAGPFEPKITRPTKAEAA